MKQFFVFFLGLMLGACCNVSQPTSSYVPGRGFAAASLESKTVALVSPEATCSGVWVSPYSFITANHCVDDKRVGDEVFYAIKEDIYPRFGLVEVDDIVSRKGIVSAHDRAHDLALVYAVLPPPHLIADVRPNLPEQGSFCQTMGHPRGLWFSYSTGDVAAVREKDIGDGARLWIQCTAPISPGNSGCGLFDETGRLTGIADAVIGAMGPAQALNLFVPSTYVAALLSRQGRY